MKIFIHRIKIGWQKTHLSRVYDIGGHTNKCIYKKQCVDSRR